MKIALFTHFFPPDPSGGVGNYALGLAQALQKRGEEVRVLCVGRWDTGPTFWQGFTDSVDAGIPVRRLQLNWNKTPRPFDYLYNNLLLHDPITQFLQTFQPDLVHILSCYTLSTQAIHIPKAMGIPVIVHLMDMWFICPNHQLIRKNGELCYGSRGDWDCQNCVMWGTKAYQALHPFFNETQIGDLLMTLGKADWVTRLPGFRGMVGDMQHRRQWTLSALQSVDRIVAPSQTIAAFHLQQGISAHLITYLPHGIDSQWTTAIQRTPSSRLRLGFLGHILPTKGIHVLIQAIQAFANHPLIELHLHGHESGPPDYIQSLKDKRLPNVYWHGGYQKDQLADIFSHLDVVVFPSLWHENNPFVIRESFAAGCPILASRVGGVTEWITDGVNGLLFTPGNAEDLADLIQKLLDEPLLLAYLKAGIPTCQTADSEVAEVVRVYQFVQKQNVA